MRKTVAFLAALLLVTLPTLSFIPVKATPGVTVNLSTSNGPIRLAVVVSGTISSTGAHVTLFWDYIRDWNGRSGKIGEGWAVDENYEVTITIPPASRGEHYIIVRDDNNMETGYAMFTVLPEISVTPDERPPGAIARASGYLINGETINLYFDGISLGSGMSDPITGYFEIEFSVPGVAPGSYQIEAYWNGVEQASTSYTVLPQPIITVMPSSGYPGDSTEVSGSNFAPNSQVDVYFGSTLVDRSGVSGAGDFTSHFNVPNVSPGTYMVIAVDNIFNVPTSTSFAVLPQPAYEVIVRPRSMLYYQGDYMSIYVESSTPLQPGTYITVRIYDPEGIPFSIIKIPTSHLVEVNGRYYTPYWLSVVSPVIPSDAEAGLWSWEAEYNLPGSANPTVISGNLLVAPRASISYILDMLNQMASKLNSIETKEDQIITLINDHNNFILLRLDTLESNIANALFSGFSDMDHRLTNILFYCASIDGRLQSVEDGIVRIETSLGELYIKVDDLMSLVEDNFIEVRNGIVEIKAGILNLQTSLGNIDAKINRVESGIAYLNTTLGEVSVRIEELNATIVDVIQNASGEIMVRVDTAAGEILVKLNQLNATLTNLFLNSKGEIIAKINSAVGSLTATLNKLNATIESINGNTAYIKTRIGVIEANTESIKRILNDMNATLYQVKDGVALINVGVSDLRVKLSALNATISRVIGTDVGVNTVLGNITSNITLIRNLINGSRMEILNGINRTMVSINTAEGQITARINALNTAITGLIRESNGKLLAAVDSAVGTLLVPIENINATVSAVEDDIVTINTLLGEVRISTADLLNLTTNVWKSVANENVTVMQKVTGIEIALLNTLLPKVSEASEAAVSMEEKASEALGGLTITTYATVVAAVAAAVLSAINLLQKREAS